MFKTMNIHFKVAPDLCGKITLCFIKVRVILFLYKYWRSLKVFSSFINKYLYGQVYFDHWDQLNPSTGSQKICQTWQIAQTLMRRRLIWVYAICICPLFCINAFTTFPLVRTVNFRQATPLAQVHSSLRLANGHVHNSQFGPYII